MQKKRRAGLLHGIVFGLFAGVAFTQSTPAHADYLTIYAGPTYDSVAGNGYTNQGPSHFTGRSSDAGSGFQIGVGSVRSSGANLGLRAVRWDTSGWIELGNLGTDNAGISGSEPFSVNTSGVIVGHSRKYVSGVDKGERPVFWNATGGITELGILGTGSNGFSTDNWAKDINNVGTIVGFSAKYLAGVNQGGWPVRWDSSGNAIELGNLGSGSIIGNAEAVAINDSGIIAGHMPKFVSGVSTGFRAVRWDASGAVTELGNLGLSNSGSASVFARQINPSGTIIGWADKYVSGAIKGQRAVRWDASGTAATELDSLGVSAAGISDARPYAINSSGETVGYSDNSSLAQRPVRWNAVGSAVTKLGDLGTDAVGNAYSINDDGFIVGWTTVAGNKRAVLWGLNDVAIDLNTLIDPASGWTLTEADFITNDYWVSGIGSFDPDGPGGMAAFNRSFLIQIPEPAITTMLTTISLTLCLRFRRSM